MAVYKVDKLFTWSGGIDHEGRRTYNVLYQAWTDVLTDGPATVLNSPLTPKIGDVYPGDAFAFCTNVDPQRVDAMPYLWHVNTTYKSIPFPEGEFSGWTMRGYFQKRKKGIIEDLDGERIENTAGDLFMPPYEIDVGDQAIAFEKDATANPAPEHYKGWNKVNEQPMFGYDVGEVLCYDARWQLAIDDPNNGQRYRITLVFVCRDGGFLLKPINVGLRRKGDARGGVVSASTPAAEIRSWNITDPQGNVADTPQPLDEHGNINPPGFALHNLEFRVIETFDFTPWNVPNPQLKPLPDP